MHAKIKTRLTFKQESRGNINIDWNLKCVQEKETIHDYHLGEWWIEGGCQGHVWKGSFFYVLSW